MLNKYLHVCLLYRLGYACRALKYISISPIDGATLLKKYQINICKLYINIDTLFVC